MPLDPLPGKLVTPTRDQEVARYLRDYSIRNPGARTDAGTLPYIDAQVMADATSVHRSNAVTIANGIARATMTGPQLDDEAKRLGTFRLPPTGGGGFVTISTGLAGSTVVSGDLLAGPNNTRFRAVQSGTVLNGAQVPVLGVTTGPGTNLDAGTILRWVSPRTGMGRNATIVQQADGTGLRGGNDQESDADLLKRLDDIAANPPAAGNDAHYQSVLAVTPGLSVQKAFTVPGVLGSGTIAFTITLRPVQPGASRAPTSAQLALASAYVQSTMPADDGGFPSTIIEVGTPIALQVSWAPTAPGWADSSPFPLYQSTFANNWTVTSAIPITPTSFNIASTTDTTIPPVGGSFAVFDLKSLVFRRKQILSATANAGGYDITVDPSFGVSDLSFAPSSGQLVSPWSDSLNTLVPPIVPYFDGLGPGEMFANFADPGLRQRRSPANPQFWPSAITNRLLGGTTVPQPPQGPQQNQPAVPTLLNLSTLQDVLLAYPPPPFAPSVGTPGVSFNMLVLGDLAAYPE